MIVIELVYNLALLVALSVVSVFIEGKFDHSTIVGKVLQGILFGVIAVVGMLYPLVLSEGIIFDGRSIVISTVTLFFGPVAGLISSALAAAHRIQIGGEGAFIGVMVILASYIIGLAFHLYQVKGKPHKVPVTTMLYNGVLVHIATCALLLTLPLNAVEFVIQKVAFTVLFIYPLISVMIGSIIRNQLSVRSLLEDVAESEEKIRLLIDSTDDIIFTVDSNKIITGVYGSFSKIRGKTAADYVGKTTMMILPPSDAELHDEMLSIVLNGEITTYEWSYDTPDGLQYIQTKLTPIRNANQQLIGAVGVGRNITERKRAELEIRSQLDRLTQISWIQSHVVRAPVTRIMSLVELLSDEKGTIEAEDSREILQYIMDSAKELDGIIHDIAEKSESKNESKNES